MRSFAPLLSSVIPFAICVLVAAAALADDEPPATEWVCPPCGGSCDATIHSAPGRCEQCGMQLVRKQEVRARNVAILVFDGVQIIDYAGPYEVFGQAGFTVFTVSKTGEPITTAMGMRVTPTYALDQAPPAEVIVVPGGHVEDTYVDQEVLDWLRERSTHAAKVMSVCNGAFIMARAGLLDDMRATTFYGLIDDLRTFAPKVEVVADQRFVDNGKVVTTAGLSSGIDGSLHVIGEML
ncbi:MAG TPA: DJ-1/PfpI family protein, partial [Candidatus Polarisedimenticolaceae bacterium]|nr:DJ-1/PfpI family protein [Candidatus Polarisedimenticolaceae bacterium]